jgi:hypothetical protein
LGTGRALPVEAGEDQEGRTGGRRGADHRAEEFAEPWRQQDGVAAQDEDGVLVAELESLGRQMTKALGGRAEEQGDHAGGPHVCGQGLVGQAALEERTPIVLVEHGSGVRARADRLHL